MMNELEVVLDWLDTAEIRRDEAMNRIGRYRLKGKALAEAQEEWMKASRDVARLKARVLDIEKGQG